ncbi:MAG TPA: lipoprotein [Gammaproteobacteria bacterium]|nr:lipoprotein [Gammaproteobacteria bacterium]
MKARLLSAVLAAVFAVAAVSVSGCGQKGPLVLPSKQGPASQGRRPASPQNEGDGDGNGDEAPPSGQDGGNRGGDAPR